jgi:hypothetical protein
MALKDVFLLKIVFCVEWLTWFFCAVIRLAYSAVSVGASVKRIYLARSFIYVFAYLKQ